MDGPTTQRRPRADGMRIPIAFTAPLRLSLPWTHSHSLPMHCVSSAENSPLVLKPNCPKSSHQVRTRTPTSSSHPDDAQVSTSVPSHSAHSLPSSPQSTGHSNVNRPAPSLSLSLGLLNLTTVLWGTQHAVIKLALADIPPSTLNFSRFLLAALVSLPALRSLRIPRPQNILTTPVFRYGFELSIYLFAGYALQSAALVTTTASRSAFLLYLNVKLVPFFARVLYARPIAVSVWVSAFIALSGTILLTYDGSPPALGDAFSVAAAAASALFILRTETAARNDAIRPAQLNAVTLLSVATLMGIWTGIDAFSHGPVGLSGHWTLNDLTALLSTFVPDTSQSLAAVAYLAFVTTALCNYIQAIGQRGVSAERAAIVFAMDPVYGAIFAWFLLGETFGVQGLIGASCIVVAAVLSAISDSSRSSTSDNITVSGSSDCQNSIRPDQSKGATFSNDFQRVTLSVPVSVSSQKKRTDRSDR